MGSRRIAVVGTTGSGKTTLARLLAGRLRLPHVELDALHWEPGWTEAPAPLFRRRVEAATAGDGWVTDGNYRSVADIVLARADTVVWLDYALPTVLWRLALRTLRRCLTREQLWNGNQERLWTQLFSRESLFLWALRTHGRNRRRYGSLTTAPGYSHLRLVRLRSPAAARAWLAGATYPPAPSPRGKGGRNSLSQAGPSLPIRGEGEP